MTAAPRQAFALRFDVAYGASIGARERQEDALACDFPAGSSIGFAVLADGMGGHSAGDIASKIVVTEVFSDLKMRSGDPARLEAGLSTALDGAARAANTCLGRFVAQKPQAHGMGSTLLAPVLIEDRLYWISIGDSPLYLFRDGRLTRLNALHTLAGRRERALRIGGQPQSDRAEVPAEQDGLTSALVGGPIAEIDCPQKPLRLRAGDIVMASSDGILSLDHPDLQTLLQKCQGGTAREICDDVLSAIKDLGDPDQDNVSLCLIKMAPLAGSASPEAAGDLRRSQVTRERAVTIVASISRPIGPSR